MMRRTVWWALMAAVLGVALAAGGPASAGTLSLVEGRVASVVPGGVVVLEDGVRVLLPPGREADGERLAPGTPVRVVGRWTAEGLVVLGVELAGSAPLPRRWWGREPWPAGPDVARADSDGTEVRGTVLTVDAGGFELLPEGTMRAWRVEAGPWTRWVGLEGLDALRAGDRVEVRGEVSEGVLVAASVELLATGEGGDGDGEGDGDGDGGGDGGDGGGGEGGGEAHHESEGFVEALLPPDRFRLDDGHTYLTDTATVWDPALGGYGGLEEGDFVEVRARYRQGELLALQVELESERGTAMHVRLDGVVASVDVTGMVLEDGTAVAFGPRTEFEGDAERWDDLAPGWSVAVEAVRMMGGRLVALEVMAEDRVPPTVEGQSYEPSHALVVLAEGADPAAVASRHGATVEGAVAGVAYLFVWPVPIDDALLARLDGDPDVVAVEPNYLFRDPESERRRYPIVDRSPATGEYVAQAALAQAGVTSRVSSVTGRGIVVAVMDTGVDPLHPALRRHLWEPGLDVVDGDLEPWETRDGLDQDGDGDVDEAAGHGTFVASVIALVAPGARIVPYRVLDDDGGGTAYGLALALADALRRHVDVINLSLAYRTRSRAVDQLLAEAERRGIVVVASAGNDGLPELPYPASDAHTVAVTALAADGTGLAPFANTGPSPLLAAPGEDVYGALDGLEWGTSSGSSMAAPFVAGAAALLLEADPGLDPALVRELLAQSARPIADGGATDGALDVAAAVAVASP